VTITRATAEDSCWCARLMSDSDPWVTLGRGYKDCLARCRHPEYELWIAREEAGVPLGFILLHPRGVAGSPYVASVAVAPEARGRGAGTELMALAEKRWPEARHLFLCVSSFNAGARRLYERLGFRAVGTLEDYVIEGADEILMHKRLARP
jgi:[ribosomal protein S18]-alanine N-acetyltransferase